MKFIVFHAVNPTFGFGEQPKFPEEYKKVAVIDCDSLNDTFRVTNHIDEDWTTNPEVISTCGDNLRSTSVGDVMLDDDGTAHYCDHVGWKTLKDY